MVTITTISLVTRTKGAIKLFQITDSGLKELKEYNYRFELNGTYSAWWEAISLSDSLFKGSEQYRFVGVLANGKRVQFCLHEIYRGYWKSYTISSSKGLGMYGIGLKLTNLTPNARYLIDGEYRNADDDGCITVNFHCINNYKWLSSGRLHVSRVDNYGFTDIVDIKLSLWNP